MEENKKEEKKKLNIKERWKDKRERAKIELMLYGIFFLAIIIFARISSSFSDSNIPKDNDIKSHRRHPTRHKVQIMYIRTVLPLSEKK